MNKMWKHMFLKYFIFCINSLRYHHQYKPNVIRLYDYSIIGRFFVREAFALFPDIPKEDCYHSLTGMGNKWETISSRCHHA
jgi:hypothetical protein